VNDIIKQSRTTGRQCVSVYLPDALYQRFRSAATRQGVSLSAYLSRQLSTMPNQIEELQNWLAARLDRIESALAGGGKELT
jgi:hypothetical protein